MDADVYGHREEIRLDERQLSRALGVSRTPIREAMTLTRAGRLPAHRSAPRRLHRPENQEGDHRDHRSLRGAGEHGGEARDNNAYNDSISAGPCSPRFTALRRADFDDLDDLLLGFPVDEDAAARKGAPGSLPAGVASSPRRMRVRLTPSAQLQLTLVKTIFERLYAWSTMLTLH